MGFCVDVKVTFKRGPLNARKKKQTNKCTVKQALCPRIFNLVASGSKVCEYSNEVAKSTLEAVFATAKKLKGLGFFVVVIIIVLNGCVLAAYNKYLMSVYKVKYPALCKHHT